MAEATGGSTIPKRQLGRYLRELRNEVGMTMAEAADDLEWSAVKLWRIETGKNAMRGHDVELMCRMYGADDEMTGALVGLAKGAKKSDSWWASYRDVISPLLDVYIGLETDASHMALYESELVHGLFQTAAYARTVIAATHKDEVEIDRRLSVRLGRQTILKRGPRSPQIDMVIGESILVRQVGSPEVMASQLAFLAEASALPQVSIRVLPLRVGFHRGTLSGPFGILRFPPARGKRERLGLHRRCTRRALPVCCFSTSPRRSRSTPRCSARSGTWLSARLTPAP